MTIEENDVVAYLLNNPNFFELHAELLADIRLTSPSRGDTISLHDRQTEILRKKNRDTELKLKALVSAANNNKDLIEKLMDWACLLLSHKQKETLPYFFLNSFQSTFNISDVALRFWDIKPDVINEYFTRRINEKTINELKNMTTPYCGPIPENKDTLFWLDRPEAVRSIALIPLLSPTDQKPFGLIVLGSTDVNRFQKNMATDFLITIGKLSSAAFADLIS